jgi:CDGSH iron-sulfur domain-containing protein 3
MEKPRVAQKAPYAVTVEAGKRYAWCTCGLSEKQPFCDGTHKPTAFKPYIWNAVESETVYLCGCKATGGQPFCDGTHNRI